MCLFFFSHFKHCIWTSSQWSGWPVLLNPLSLPIFFLLAPNEFLGGSNHQISLQKICSIYIFFFRNIITGWPTSSSISCTSFLCRKLLTGWRRPLWQPPRTSPPREKRRLVGRSFPVRGRATAWLTRASRKPFLAGHRSSMTLTSHCPSLRNGDNNSPFQ